MTDRKINTELNTKSTPAECEALHRIITRRRDVRAEFSGIQLADDTLQRILGAAHRAPSVGNTQPWDFIVIQNPCTLNTFAQHVQQCRLDFAEKLPDDRRKTFDPIKIDGVEEAKTGIVVTYDASRGGQHILGRDTITDAGLLSVGLAIENLWLAATAENVGVGWVSFYQENFLHSLIQAPSHIRPIAWLCIGPVTEFQTVPDLERHNWRSGRPLNETIHQESYGQYRPPQETVQ